MPEYQEYTVRIRDRLQSCVHTVHQYAGSQNEANAVAFTELRKLLGHDLLEIV